MSPSRGRCGHPEPDRLQGARPAGHYFGQRKLGVGIRDIYGRLIDGLNGAEGEVRSGGDAGAQARLQAPPPTEELVAYFTGPVEVGADGYARASFDLPSSTAR
jgi:alpha-2-macroglobulin